MARTRERRRRGQVLATVRLNQVELRKLAALGYLDQSLIGAEKGPALDAAAEALTRWARGLPRVSLTCFADRSECHETLAGP
jgi:hypothetical protein